MKSLKEEIQHQAIDGDLSSVMSQFKPNSLKGAKREFLDDHRIQKKDGETLIFKNGSTIPVDHEGRPASLEQAIEGWIPQEKNNYLFGQGSGGSHLTTADTTIKEIDKIILQDTKIVSAMKKASVYYKYLNDGKSVSSKEWAAVEAFLGYKIKA